MKRLTLFITMTCLLLQVSAKPPKLPKPPKEGGPWVEPVKPKNIYGNWVWIETNCCGLRQGLSTPATAADDLELALNKDNTFMETHTKKNALPRSGNFELFREVEYDMIRFNDERPARYHLSTNGDTLTISWKYLELQVEKYIRKK